MEIDRIRFSRFCFIFQSNVFILQENYVIHEKLRSSDNKTVIELRLKNYYSNSKVCNNVTLVVSLIFDQKEMANIAPSVEINSIRLQNNENARK